MHRLLLALLLVVGCAAGPPGDVRLAYSERGSGPVVVLLHGHPQTSASWRGVVPALARKHRVIVVDQRGQGSSPAPDDGYDVRTRARDVVALLRRLDVRRAAVVGTDLGGHTAYALARDEPDLVRRLVVLEAVIPGTRAARGPLSSPHIDRHADVDVMAERTRGREDEHVRSFVCAGRDPCPHPPELLAEAAAALRRPGHLRGAFAPYEELAEPPDDPGRVDVPVLAIGGERGIGRLPADSLREVAAEVTGVVLPDATHWLAEEHPEALLDALEPFLLEPRA
jgi:pimeloyl-ACP methyl ester carboxylesterase